MFSPQGGLRASADDLAVIMQLLINKGCLNGKQALTPTSVDAMLKSVWKLSSSSGNGLSAGEAEPGGDADGLMTSYGLSVHRIDMRAWGFEKGPRTLVGHLGQAYGVLSHALFDPVSGDGIVAIVGGTGDKPDANAGHSPLSASRKHSYTGGLTSVKAMARSRMPRESLLIIRNGWESLCLPWVR